MKDLSIAIAERVYDEYIRKYTKTDEDSEARKKNIETISKTILNEIKNQ